jgi:hypothetical protein
MPEQGYDSTREMDSQYNHIPQLIPTWSRTRYQTSSTLQPTVSHSPHACTTPGSVLLLCSMVLWLHPYPFRLQHRADMKSHSTMALGFPASLIGLQVPSRPHTREPIPTLLPPGLQPSPRQHKDKCTHTQVHLGSTG